MNRLLTAAFFVLALTNVSAQVVRSQADGNPTNWCREGLFTKEGSLFSIVVAKGKPSDRVYFHDDDPESCPGDEKCRRRSYVIGGDRLVVNRKYDGFVCGWYAPRSGKAPTVGWLKQSDVFYQKTDERVPLSAWLGEWKYADNSINFTHNKLAGFLNVTGDAFWKGVGDNIHIGELDGRFQPRGGVIMYSDGDDEYDCKAKMRMVGEFLVVSDNMNCGGANVSFSGIYRRTKRY